MNQVKDCPLCGYPDIIEDEKNGLVKCVVCGAQWEIQPDLDKNAPKDYNSVLNASSKNTNLALRLLEYQEYIRYHKELPIELIPENRNSFIEALQNSKYTNLNIHYVGAPIEIIKINSSSIKDIDKLIGQIQKNKFFANEAWKVKGVVVLEIKPLTE